MTLEKRFWEKKEAKNGKCLILRLMKRNRTLAAEWYPQGAIQLTWPHAATDWAPVLEEAITCFVAIGRAILESQKLLIVCTQPEEVRVHFLDCPQEHLYLVVIPSNDTWARDHGAITVLEKGKPVLLDFKFNGWGDKFAADLDDQINAVLWDKKIFNPVCTFEDHRHFVLEGGGIESDGKGSILTTKDCLLNPNRNPHLSQREIENYLKKSLGAERILWLNHGYLAGDDTDSHIDTLARFCNENTIAYVQCLDTKDEHFESLKAMEMELKALRKTNGEAYDLVPLPMADPVYEDGNRLPATYANFLITNDKVLLPFYGSLMDQVALERLSKVFPQREVHGINCRVLIKQHGSLHCVTMQYPESVL